MSLNVHPRPSNSALVGHFSRASDDHHLDNINHLDSRLGHGLDSLEVMSSGGGSGGSGSGVVGSAASATTTASVTGNDNLHDFTLRDDFADLLLLHTTCGYKGSFYPVGHSFTVTMQDDAFDWLAQQMLPI